MDNRHPNVLWIVADQLQPGALSSYGNTWSKTPNIQGLADNGIQFNNAYCNSPLCGPSRMSLLTGKYVHNIETWDNGTSLNSGIPTVPHYFGAAGYKTCLSGKMHFVGPDQLHGYEDRLTSDIYPSNFEWTYDWNDKILHPGRDSEIGPKTWVPDHEYDDQAQTRALEWLRMIAGRQQNNRNTKPFFLTASFTNPHPPFVCPKKYWDFYEGVDIPLPSWPDGHIEGEHIVARWIRDYHRINELPSDEESRIARRAYFGKVSYVDDLVGQLVSCLESLDLLKNTIIVFLSDHGEMLGEHGCWCKRVNYESSAKVPLIIADPRSSKEGTRVNEVTQLVDLLPTMNDLCDLENPILVDGHSLSPFLNEEPEPYKGKEALVENYTEGVKASSCMLRKGNLKYVEVVGHEPALYDLKADPNEWKNVAGRADYTEMQNEMAARLRELWDGNAIEKKVRESKARRFLINKAHAKGKHRTWDYRPQMDSHRRWGVAR